MYIQKSAVKFNKQIKESDMGKGDRRSKKGKIYRHSFGKTRPHKKKDAKTAASKTKSEK